MPEHEFLMTADPATNTIYAGNLSQPQIDVINGATCHAGHLTGCAPVAKIPMADPQANVGSIDHATHTLYASDPFSDTVAVINTATCNAADTAGCAAHPPTIKSARFPNRRSSTRPPRPCTCPSAQRQPGRGSQRRHLQRHRHLRLRADPGRGQGRDGHLQPRGQPRHRHRLRAEPGLLTSAATRSR